MTNYHLAILKRPYLSLILAGKKCVESRFSRTKRSPFDQIKTDDKIFFKISSGPVCAAATVKSVKTFENLAPKQILKLKAEYNHLICAADEYWESKKDCKFGTLIWLKSAKSIKPVRIDKKDWRPWVVLTKQKNFGLFSHDSTGCLGMFAC